MNDKRKIICKIKNYKRRKTLKLLFHFLVIFVELDVYSSYMNNVCRAGNLSCVVSRVLAHIIVSSSSQEDCLYISTRILPSKNKCSAS